MEKPKAMIVSVGGSHDPVVISLNQRRPDYLIYFTSSDSRRKVREDIEPALSFRPIDHHILETPDSQDLGASVSELMRELPRRLKSWGLEFCDLVGDFTGGTKTMSAALVLALAERGCLFSYIGGKSRSKDGLGVVLSGHEEALHFDNPWDALAVGPCRDAALLFNRCRFMAVSELAEKTAQRTDYHQPFFVALQCLANAYYAWDTFHYDRALNLLKRGESQLRGYASASQRPMVKRFYGDVRANIPLLEQIKKEFDALKSHKAGKANAGEVGTNPPLLIQDLVANAVRRAVLEHKYDDAVARLYSAIEKLAKHRLLTAHGIDNSDIDLARVPDVIREHLLSLRNSAPENRSHGDHAVNSQGDAKLASENKAPKIQIPLRKSYELLSALNDPLGQLYLSQEIELDKVLSIRNMSLLAHGFDPIKPETYQKLVDITLIFLGLDIERLPRLPQLAFDGEGL